MKTKVLNPNFFKSNFRSNKISKKIFKLSFSSYLLLQSLLIINSVNAEEIKLDEPSQLVCAAAVPCDENGNLLPQFSDETSGCYKEYLKRCSKFQLENEIYRAEPFLNPVVCKNKSKRKYEIKIKELQNKIKKLKKASSIK